MKPVMYLDIDDTLLSMHSDYYPLLDHSAKSTWRHWGFAPPGAAEFMRFALEHYEVRWLTWWCSSHEMYPEQIERLEREFDLEPGALSGVRSARFNRVVKADGSDLLLADGCHKTNGIDWSEHEAGRPWIWVEDRISEREQQVLRGRGCLDRWHPCHVTEDPHALQRLHAKLAEEVG